jgi:hypothetical protein
LLTDAGELAPSHVFLGRGIKRQTGSRFSFGKSRPSLLPVHEAMEAIVEQIGTLCNRFECDRQVRFLIHADKHRFIYHNSSSVIQLHSKKDQLPFAKSSLKSIGPTKGIQFMTTKPITAIVKRSPRQ